jgi:hypothetical protein
LIYLILRGRPAAREDGWDFETVTSSARPQRPWRGRPATRAGPPPPAAPAPPPAPTRRNTGTAPSASLPWFARRWQLRWRLISWWVVCFFFTRAACFGDIRRNQGTYAVQGGGCVCATGMRRTQPKRRRALRGSGSWKPRGPIAQLAVNLV